MSEVFPLSGHPRCFIPTASANFFENILDDVLEDIFYPRERETNPNLCVPTILNANSFLHQMKPDEAMELVDDFCSKRFKKHQVVYFEETYSTSKIYDDYMKLKPTCFLVLGAPDSRHYEAAKIFAEHTNRIHLDVVELVNLEMSKKSQCGKWIYSNLCEGRCIPVSIVLELVQEAVSRSEVQQRGYVLSGFPIIPEQMFSADILPKRLSEVSVLENPPSHLVAAWLGRKLEDNVGPNHTYMKASSETSTVSEAESFTDKDQLNGSDRVSRASVDQLPIKFDTLYSPRFASVELANNIMENPFLEQIMDSTSLNNKIDENDVKRSVRHQFNFLLHLDLVPDILFTIRVKPKDDVDTFSRKNYSLDDSDAGTIVESTVFSTEPIEVDEPDIKAQRQRGRYQNCLGDVGKFVLHFYKESIIKVDYRFSAEAMANQFQSELTFINYKMIYMPEWIFMDNDLKMTWAELSSEQLLDALCEYQCLQPNLRWKKSETGTMCPVELYLGKIEHGIMDYAVRYLGHVFLLSSFSAMSQFISDPNRYFFCKPNCRVGIISPEMKQSKSISRLLQGMFQASTLDWKDLVSLSPGTRLKDIYAEATNWAEQHFEENKAAFHRLATQGPKKSGTGANSPKVISTASPRDMLYRDILNKLIEYKYYQLYKERHSTKIAKLVKDWLEKQENDYASKGYQQTYAQWIIQDLPATLTFWEELEANGCLPDVVICLHDSEDNEPDADNMNSDHKDMRRDIQKFCTNMKANFPKLLKERPNINFEELVDNTLGKLDYSVDIFQLSKLHSGKSSVRYKLEDEETDALDVSMFDFFAKQYIPVIVPAHRGRKGALEALEKYMGIFKYRANVLNEERVKELCDISSDSLIKIPNIPINFYPEYNFIYKLDIQYLHNEATFQYNELLQNFAKLGDGEEIDANERFFNLTDRLYDIDVLSEDNIQSMKEKDYLRQINLGDTGKYCPVAMSNQNILRLGDLSFTVEYGSKVYRMSSAEALDEFMKCPFRYIFEEKKPSVPPYRICVVGPPGPKRNNFAKALSRRLNMRPQSYEKLFAEYLEMEYPGNSLILNTENQVYAQYGEDFLESSLKTFFKSGIILEGFPNNELQLRDMFAHDIYPELIYIVDTTPNEALHFTLAQHNLRWEKQLEFQYRTYMQNLAKFSKFSAEKNEAEMKNALNNIKMMIKSTQDAILGDDALSQSQNLSTSLNDTSSAFFPLVRSVTQPSQDDVVSRTQEESKKLGLSESALDKAEYELDLLLPEQQIEEAEEELEFQLESPIPSPQETIAIKKNLMVQAKSSLKSYLNELRKVIRLCISSNIPVIKIPIDYTRKSCEPKFDVCNPLQRRFIFDQVIVIPPAIADQSLVQGYTLYSHFKNFCPVDAYNIIPTNLHFTIKKKGELHGVIYRGLLYYTNGSKNLARFSVNPRKFASKKSPFYLVLPMRILVIGPVCSGVTTLCNRISLEFNMAHLSKGIFDSQNDQGSSSRNQSIQERARHSGISQSDLPSEAVLERLVEYLYIHRNDSPNGMILDNYPITPVDLVKAAEANIALHIVMIIKTEFWAVWRNWKATYMLETFPKYVFVPNQLVNLYESFRKYNKIVQKYQLYQGELELFNIFYLKNIASKWSLWEEAKNEILVCFREIGNYNRNVQSQQVVSVTRMNMFRVEFEKRLSPLKLFCPICLKVNGRLVKYRYDFQTVSEEFYSPACQEEFNQPFGYNLDSLYEKYHFPRPEALSDQHRPIFSKNMFKINLVQYLGNFYWTCDKHHIDILLNGKAMLPPERMMYPPYIPFLVINYFGRDVANEGYCIVTYIGSLPKRVLVAGNPNFAVFYRGKIYLCASSDCALQFLENPHFYYHAKIEPDESDDEDEDTNNMAINYGTLTPEIIIEALKVLGEARPKHFALDIANSAAIFVGLYLKTINPANLPGLTQFNEDIYSKFIDECRYLEWLIKKYHETKNPYIQC